MEREKSYFYDCRVYIDFLINTNKSNVHIYRDIESEVIPSNYLIKYFYVDKRSILT